MANYRASYTAQEKKLFASKLRQLMIEKGLKGAELARRVSKYLPKPIVRQSVSSYLAGASIPEEPTLRGLERALDVPPGILLPRPHKTAPGEATVEEASTHEARMALTAGGKMRLMLNVEVPQSIGWQILKLLEEVGH
jgi:transcriptional regulator with XRE-family HTH domain